MNSNDDHIVSMVYALEEKMSGLKMSKAINVLSLFDGMSCGQLALKNKGIKVKNYFSSEIDKHAIEVARLNHPTTIHVGDVKKLRYRDGYFLHQGKRYKIDLILAGSPCQGFSFAGKELNFSDPRSALFFEFIRLKKALRPKHFLLENVVMRKPFQDVITRYVGLEPVMINSSLVSAQTRKRLYWTNLKFSKLEDHGVLLKDILELEGTMAGRMVGRRLKNGKRCDHDKSIKAIQRIEINENAHKTNCLTTVQKDNVILTDESHRYLTVLECERLQTLPDHYTRGVSKTQRLKMIGNGWTVKVIEHIVAELKYA